MWLWNTLKERPEEVHQGGGCLKEEKARLIFSHLSSAVNFLHQRRITRCDIKLENILLGEPGQDKLYIFRGPEAAVSLGLLDILALEILARKPYDGMAGDM
ncbi:hypothetical protein U0070_013926 [Myodes glareolus]|uniref:Protein kinase domain-containing protein n=1 Tax=Myodes glareolus TaxID=447135 RepID=A0AAW0GZ97_MYOGA